jgi:hypothetical protein
LTGAGGGDEAMSGSRAVKILLVAVVAAVAAVASAQFY